MSQHGIIRTIFGNSGSSIEIFLHGVTTEKLREALLLTRPVQKVYRIGLQNALFHQETAEPAEGAQMERDSPCRLFLVIHQVNLIRSQGLDSQI